MANTATANTPAATANKPALVAPAAAPTVAAATPLWVLAKANPKAPTSRSHARFALYASNPTVQQYIAACVALGQPNAQRNARADIAWDVRHGFITLTKPTA